MSLTSSAFQWLTVGVAIAVTIAVIVLWNRIRGPRPVKLAGRLTLLAASYLTAALAVLVSINIMYGGLIATWGDLFANLNPAPANWHPHHQHGHGYHRYGPPSGIADYQTGPHPPLPRAVPAQDRPHPASTPVLVHDRGQYPAIDAQIWPRS